MKVDTQTELEKTQLEIAKLQLEQEKHKLAQMQRRSEAVSDLGRGAAAVGGVAVKGGSAMLLVVLTVALAAFTGFLGVALAAFVILKGGASCPLYPDAGLLYRAVCALGTKRDWLVGAGAAGFLLGAVLAFRELRGTTAASRI